MHCGTMQRCLVLSRWTLLHPFTKDRCRKLYIEEFEHHRDDMRNLIIDEYATVLGRYDMPVPRYDLPAEMCDEKGGAASSPL